MSNLRKLTKKDTDVRNGDIEASIVKNSPASGSASAPRGAKYNPVFLAKAIFHKVLGIIFSTEEENLTEPGGIITLLKDVLVGVIFGVMTISFMILLDHSNVIHFQSAHNFRNAAFQLLNDPETIANLEESSDLKFLTVIDFDSKQKEINAAESKITSSTEVLEKRTKEVDEKQKDLDSIKAEYDSLFGNPLLGLKAFCGDCVWGGKTSCGQRVQFLQDTYNTRPIAAKMNAMVHTSCVSK